MRHKPVCRKALLGLLAGSLIAPIVVTVVLALAGLLGAMGDGRGAGALRYVALGVGAAWAVVLVCLVVAQGLNSLVDEEALADEESSAEEESGK